MVRRIGFLLTAVFLATAAACGGGDDSDTATQANSAARPTETTSARPSTGPRAVIEPREGPPGTRVTITGSGWKANEAIDILGGVARGETPPNYGSVTADASGGFTYSFRLETGVGGAALQPGRFDVIVKSTAGEVDVPFLVESRRPVGGNGPGG
jgi:hypothetical protein